MAISALREAARLAPVAYAPPGDQGTSAFRWSTDQVDPKDRFDYWREVRTKGLFGATAELDREHRPKFAGEFSLRKIGSAGLIGLRASSYHVERSATDIANAPSDSLCICQQLGGGGWFRVRNVDDFHVAGGTFATSYSDLPYHTVPIAAEGFDLRILKVPVADILLPLPGLHDLVAKPFTDRAALTPLLESCFTDLTEADGDSDPATTKALVQTLTHLTLIERGVARPTSRVAQYAVRAGRLSLARRLMARHIAEPQLSPAFVASQLAISVRHLHVLFEESSMSFSQTVTALRIERSRRLLREAPAMTIAEIAFASGFDSLATFYRVFRAAQGVTPGDFREAATRK
ncbi:AraC family transcriptional regulator [Bradyrhizobium sp. AUGA SZCCT0431]|uniref:helix-turn-helix transcriptional regulator n=1 Tax=Bradyrhizobium sp. AUGA SZCCT0431 TaxID=2807674 RepID=UPI0028A0635C|nr:AraC family transcriptional regulator [Bradyrhizobium sp. AUGA SZCCT0431]